MSDAGTDRARGARSLPLTIVASFMGHASHAYKAALLLALAANVLLWWLAGPVVAGWAILLEFIAVLALSLQCYPLAPGGLLALEAVLLGLATPANVYTEVARGLPVILLLLFMVSAIAFMQELLVYIFARLLTAVRSHTLLSLCFCLAGAVLSAFLDALTVIAVVITVALGLYRIYFLAASGMTEASDRQLDEDVLVPPTQHATLQQLRAALRGLAMHAAVGTALGGVCTLVGEPQNLLIGSVMGWDFQQFAWEVAPVSMPVLAVGLLTCLLVERFKCFGFGVAIPAEVRAILLRHEQHEALHRTQRDRWRLAVQAVVAVLLVIALAFHWAEVGLIGLTMVVLLTALLGVSEEHRLAEAMKTAIPFTGLLVVFFAIVAMIDLQQLFAPLIHQVALLQGPTQTAWMYLANGALSAISDNVFVATVYIHEVERLFAAGQLSPEQYARLAVAVNTGTNIPSVATPNGQAAFLFLLTSALAPLLRLSYGRMCYMALPYLVTMTLTGLLATIYWLH
jgi:NhaB family Na+:H+ antiporter